MKIYTKTGDKGITSLLGGNRVLKSNLRIEAYGTLDELNSFVGLLKDQDVNQKRAAFLKQIQDRLFTLGATLATGPGKEKVKKPDLLPADILALETEIDLMDQQLEPLKKFILPGGHPAVSISHLARTVCRRSERCVVHLNESEQVDEITLQYLNRLSDYFFVLGRLIAKELGVKEVTWEPRV